MKKDRNITMVNIVTCVHIFMLFEINISKQLLIAYEAMI
jgi:hypothetical protein